MLFPDVSLHRTWERPTDLPVDFHFSGSPFEGNSSVVYSTPASFSTESRSAETCLGPA
jgi:hypothetical protein